MIIKEREIKFVEKSKHPRFINLERETFQRLKVISFAGKLNGNGNLSWYCSCNCGKFIIATTSNLKSGNTKSCGCLDLERKTKHGKSDSNEYHAYESAYSRCNNPNNKYYHLYGARGIEFRFNSFEEFYQELGDKPGNEYSLDRINVNGHYEIDNVRWASNFEQNRNRRDNFWISINGETKCLQDWVIISPVNVTTILYRIKNQTHCDTCSVYAEAYSKCEHREKIYE